MQSRPARGALACGMLAALVGSLAVPGAVAAIPTVTRTLPVAAATGSRSVGRAGAVALPAGGRVLILDARTVRNPMPHVVFGTIVGLRGTTVVLRTRTGLRSIDARPAFAAGTVSAPLFAGKSVAVDGVIAADGTLTAARITRMTRITSANIDK